MNQKNKRWITYIGVAILGVVVAALILQPKSIAVDIATIDRGILTVTIEEEGQTRARDRYTIAAPITGRLLRTEYKEGQTVQQGDVLTGIAPTPDDALTFARNAASVRASSGVGAIPVSTSPCCTVCPSLYSVRSNRPVMGAAMV